MGITKRSLTFWILVLVFCVAAAVLVPIFRANKASKLTNQSSETEIAQREQTESLSETRKNEVQSLREKASKPSRSEFEDNASITPIAVKDKRIRQREIEALEKTADSQSIALLISALKEQDMDIRGEKGDYARPDDLLLIEEALIRIGKPAVEPLIVVLKDKHNNYARFKAIKILGKIGDNQAVKPLIAVLKDNDWEIRYRASKALGELGDSSAIESLAVALKDKDKRVRYRAIEALENIGAAHVIDTVEKPGDSRVIEPLVFALKDEDMDVRERAARALGETGKLAIEPLINVALRDKSWDIKQTALVALIRITDKKFDADPQKWQNWWEQNKEKILDEGAIQKPCKSCGQESPK